MDDSKALGRRVREVRSWRGLTLREAAGLAGLSFSFWGQVERGDKAVTNRKTLEAMAGALRVHPAELIEQSWAPQGPTGTDAHAALLAIETALECYELGTDPGLTVRAWPQIEADLDRLVMITHATSDHVAMGELASVLLSELHGGYVRLPQQHRTALLRALMVAYTSAMWAAQRLGGHGLPILAARAVQQCAETLDDPVWLGYAAWLRGNATGRLDRAAQYRRSMTAADTLTSRLDSSDAVQACGMLHLSAALAAGVQADHDTAATHLTEAAALAARMDTEVGTWAHLWFGPTNVGIWRTSLAVEIGEHGQAVEAAKTVHPELLPGNVRQAEFWAEVGRALVAGKKRGTRGYACCCTLSSSLRSGSVATCLSGRPSLVCCVKPGVMPVAGSCVVWPGGWGLLRWGEPRLVCTTGAHIPGSARERLKLWGEGHNGRGEGVGAAGS